MTTMSRAGVPTAAPTSAPPTPVRMSLLEAFEHAQALQRNEKFDAAERIYLEILQQLPDEPNALNFLGVLRHQQKRTAEALALLRRAVELLPDDPGPIVNLGNVLIEAERFEEAAEALRQAVLLDPTAARVFNNFGIACMRCGDLERAEAAFLEGLALEPDRADLHFNFARLLYQTGRFRESAAHSIQALTTDPSLSSTRKLLTMSYFVLGERDKAIEQLHAWKAIEPDNPEIDHHLAACGESAVPERASDNYVQHVFDGFAASFDKKLQILGYRAPQLVTDALAAVAKPWPADAVILDAGCGTGLCGPLLRPFASRLDGVDLSAGMLDRARAAHPEYDALHQAELTAFLEARPASYDAIISADTLCYFGELAGFLSAARRSLRGPGVLIFSLEALMDDTQDHQLHIHGRYSHSKRYVLAQLAEQGFTLASFEQQVLRTELIEPVQGWIVTALCSPNND
jgi:predicted TPR repeat methyltransferase